jgi:tRNA threonylcarbamoyladenosine biosynthesis protein TsaB
MKFYMLVLALDTTTRRGSAALLRDDVLVDLEGGDPAQPYGRRLPGDLVRLLDRHGLRVRDVDLFAVAAGPGSFTGLRIGIATMQGLALTNSRPIAGISALDALNASQRGLATAPEPFYVAAWLDAQRGEIFSALYDGAQRVDGAAVDTPAATLARWAALRPTRPLRFVGDGALLHADQILATLPDAAIVPDVPLLAPAVACLAVEAATRHETTPAGGIRPIYVRRPDVELARDRRPAPAGPAAAGLP